MHRLKIALTAALLAGCATSFSILDKEAPQLVGRNLEEAIHYLGLPTGKMPLGTGYVYAWNTRTMNPFPTSTTTTTTGAFGTVPFQATSQSLSFDAQELSCTLRLRVDNQDRITAWDVNGNNGACFPFADRLKPLAK